MKTFTLKKHFFLTVILCFSLTVTVAQVGINTTTPNTDAILDVTSTATKTGGLLMPRVALTGTGNTAPLSANVAGMTVYNTATAGDVTPGYYYNDGSQWVRIAAETPSNDWSLTGNAGTTAGTNFLGTTDNQALQIQTNNNERMRLLANGQVIINDAGAPIAGDRFTVQAANNEDAINGYASGNGGVGVYGESTNQGFGVSGLNSGTGIGMIGFSTNDGIGVQGQNNADGGGVFGTNNNNGFGVQAGNSGVGDALQVFQTGTGWGIYNQVAAGVGMYNLIQSNQIAIATDLTAAGGVGELIDFHNRPGVGINVVGVLDPTDPSAGNANDVWAFASAVKTRTATTTTVEGGVLLGNQYGRGHGILMRHSGPAGRNTEIDQLSPSNPDPVLISIGLGRGSNIVAQNQNNNIPNGLSPLIVGDFSYVGTDVDDHIGISGFSSPDLGWGIGVEGTGGWYGVHGVSTPSGYGVFSTGDTGATGIKSFVIDHPNDPANKELHHFSIESNEVLNIYRGTEVFDRNGRVIVNLPDYYDAINRDASYQLTPVGASMPNLYIEKEVANGKFSIAGGVAGKKVSWILTAERNDPYLKQNPEKRNVIVDKGTRRGKYLMPQLYGKSAEQGMFYKKREKLEMAQNTPLINPEAISEKESSVKREPLKAEANTKPQKSTKNSEVQQVEEKTNSSLQTKKDN
mgnify:CR=1 FL=1